jgi:hypothetical protein
MHAKLEDWKNGWVGDKPGVALGELESLIAKLTMLKGEPDPHFHLASDFEGAVGVGDITIYVQTLNEPNNMETSSNALAPGTEIPDISPNQSTNPTLSAGTSSAGHLPRLR